MTVFILTFLALVYVYAGYVVDGTKCVETGIYIYIFKIVFFK